MYLYNNILKMNKNLCVIYVKTKKNYNTLQLRAEC